MKIKELFTAFKIKKNLKAHRGVETIENGDLFYK